LAQPVQEFNIRSKAINTTKTLVWIMTRFPTPFLYSQGYPFRFVFVSITEIQ